MRIVVDVGVDVLNFPHVINGLFSLTVRECRARLDEDDEEKSEGSAEKAEKKETNHGAQMKLKLMRKLQSCRSHFLRSCFCRVLHLSTRERLH
jgi:hypothetical protein